VRPRRLVRSSLERGTALAFVLTATALALTACGGGPSASVASLNSTTTTTTTTTTTARTPSSTGNSGPGQSGAGNSGAQESQASLGGVTVQFAQCMRTHGVPSFPDPNAQGQVTISGVGPQSASFQAAQRACAKYSPNGGKAPSPAQQAQAVAQALKFSECMRAHGISDFPDPQVSSGAGGVSIGIRINGNGSSNLNPRDPQFQAAQKACQPLMGGALGATHTSASAK
jgi:hypothetical protein